MTDYANNGNEEMESDVLQEIKDFLVEKGVIKYSKFEQVSNPDEHMIEFIAQFLYNKYGIYKEKITSLTSTSRTELIQAYELYAKGNGSRLESILKKLGLVMSGNTVTFNMYQEIAEIVWKRSIYNDDNYDAKGIKEFIVTDIFQMVSDGEVVNDRLLEDFILEIFESFENSFDREEMYRKERAIMALCHKIGIVPTNEYNEYLSYFQDELKITY
jgi:hypothetical protein